MPVYLLGESIQFPPVEHAEDGLLAVGGDLSPERLISAYRHGVFPWYSEEEPILWHSPDPRCVLRADRLRVSRRLERTIRQGGFRLTMDRAFDEVVEACAASPRPLDPGTWITTDIKTAYGELHRRGLAHSTEVWRDDALVGGLYGVSLGAAYFGESMFSRERDASKVAFVQTVRQLGRWGIRLIDCQVSSEHLLRFGAEEWSRPRFIGALRGALAHPTREGDWDEYAGAD